MFGEAVAAEVENCAPSARSDWTTFVDSIGDEV